MKGAWLHNKVLISPLVAAAGNNALIKCEARVDDCQRSRSVDLLIDWPGRRVVVEAENSAVRVARDVAKASALKADDLLLVAPNPEVARAIRQALKRIPQNIASLRILVLTPGAARQWIANQSHLIRTHAPGTSDNKFQPQRNQRNLI